MRMLEMKGKIDNDRNMDELLKSPDEISEQLKKK
jgi:hypothetical protein